MTRTDDGKGWTADEERAAHKAWLESPASSDWDPYYAFLEGWHASTRTHQQDSLPVWVACLERLPEIGHLVLVYRPHSVQKVAAMMRLKRYEGDTQYHWDGLRGNDFCLETSITHWRPLPSPPEPLMPKE